MEISPGPLGKRGEMPCLPLYQRGIEGDFHGNCHALRAPQSMKMGYFLSKKITSRCVGPLCAQGMAANERSPRAIANAGERPLLNLDAFQKSADKNLIWYPC